ncbi:hypothetical protein [Bacillus sp. ISL-77]|uniref:hypothetical protein n=1 Tax=Bacillus sp. ISL-77 TaxID=2819138 RepID=UPI001BE6EDBB|nr:hypothetical protein [Bacillus sp. ISL-77]MBT2740747.1 hypothetical protein [Bacillus sp. ISL-77]
MHLNEIIFSLMHYSSLNFALQQLSENSILKIKGDRAKLHGILSNYYSPYSERWTIAGRDIARLKESIFLFCIAYIMPKIYFKNHPNIVSFIRFFYFLDSFYLFNLIIHDEKILNDQLQIINATYLWIVAIVIVIIDFLMRLLRNGFFTGMRKYIINYAKFIKIILFILSFFIFLTCFIFRTWEGKETYLFTAHDGTQWSHREEPSLIGFIYPILESIFLFPMAFNMPRYYFKNHPYVMSFLRYFYFIFSISLVIFVLIRQQVSIENALNLSYETLIALLIFFLIVAFAIVMIDFLIILSRSVQDPRTVNGFFSKFIAYVSLILPLLTALLFPNCIFGFSYWIRLEGLPNQDTFINPFDAYYLSFVINYALPIDSSAPAIIRESIKNINSDALLAIIEIIHITVCRIIDLSIIAVVINSINDLIVKTNVKEKRFKLINSVRK